MQRRPLSQDFGVRPRIGDFIVPDAGEMIGGHVANAVSRGLDRVHFHARELGQHVGHILERRPMELEILARGEMAVAAVVIARELGELAHLARVEDAIRNRDPQHVGVQLQIDAIHQAMGAELLLGKFPAEAPRHLVTELFDPRRDESGVEIVIMIHDRTPSRSWDPHEAPDHAPASPDRA